MSTVHKSSKFPHKITLTGTTYRKRPTVPTCMTGGHPVLSKVYYTDGDSFCCSAHPPPETKLPHDGKDLADLHRIIQSHKLVDEKDTGLVERQILSEITQTENTNKSDETALLIADRPLDADLVRGVVRLVESKTAKEWRALLGEEDDEDWDGRRDESNAIAKNKTTSEEGENEEELSAMLKDDAMKAIVKWRKTRHVVPLRDRLGEDIEDPHVESPEDLQSGLDFASMIFNKTMKISDILGGDPKASQATSFGDWDVMENTRLDVYTTGTCGKPDCTLKGRTFQETNTMEYYEDGKSFFHPECLVMADVSTGLHDIKVEDMEVLGGDVDEFEEVDKRVEALE